MTHKLYLEHLKYQVIINIHIRVITTSTSWPYLDLSSTLLHFLNIVTRIFNKSKDLAWALSKVLEQEKLLQDWRQTRIQWW